MKSEQNKQELEVSIVTEAEEIAWFDQQLNKHHYLGAGRRVGDYLRQVVRKGEIPVALMVWGPASYSLKDRDLWIGWSANARAERLKLIVQNRRFLLLEPKGSQPNLASQAMGATLRVLPEQWMKTFGYRPLLAESFTDPESYEGTSYKASNWEAVGTTAGYSRHRADFYIPNERPKRLWMKELCPKGKQAIASAALPKDCLGGVVAPPSGVLPIKQSQIDSLRNAFLQAPDPRKKNRVYSMASILSVIAMALLAGRREIAEIVRFANSLSPKQRKLLWFPLKKGTAAFYKVPCYSVFYQVLTRMDPEAFAASLAGWLQERAGTLPGALAMDGKMIRDHIGLLTLAQHDDGTPQAVAVYDEKKGTERCEQTAAVKLLEDIPSLDGKTITADALHCQKKTAHAIVEKGGDYVLQIKANQPNLFGLAKTYAASGSPFLPSPNAAEAR